MSNRICFCRHCHKRPVQRPRRLCWTCYYWPGVREKYPSTSKFARRGVGNFCGLGPLPTFPTFAAPGSEEKIAIMCERAKNSEQLHHPLDCRLPSAI